MAGYETSTYGRFSDVHRGRSVANYVARVIEKDLAAKPRKHRSPLDGNPREKREGYEVNLTLTIPERQELKKRAEAERRSLSNYVARLVVAELV